MTEAEEYNQVSRWLLKQHHHISDFTRFLHDFVKLLNSFHFEIIRCNLGVRTSHPQVEAIAFNWSDFQHFHEPVFAPTANIEYFNLGDGIVFINKVQPGSMGRSQFTNSPIPLVVNQKQEYRHKFNAGETADSLEFPILRDLLVFEPTDYIALPLFYNENEVGFSSFVSKKEGGLNQRDIELLRFSLQLFSMKFESYLQSHITQSLLKLYLGNQAGAKVVAGRVNRGDVENIESVIWFSDIRRFTAMMNRHQAEDVIQWLNEYFDGVIAIIEKYNGEVLKFIGDGLLAVFIPEHPGKARQIKYQALLCARDTSRFLKSLNLERAGRGLPPLEHGVGLHYGSVAFGNIGASSRLDFTVIGEAVNKASRIAGLCARLQREVLISSELADQLKLTFIEMGAHVLKGIDAPQGLKSVDFQT